MRSTTTQLAKNNKKLLSLLSDLLEWEQETGGWEAPIWNKARRLLAKMRECKP